MVVPDHRGEPSVIAEGIGELATAELKIIHEVVDALKSALKSKLNPANDVLQVHPGIDVVAVLGHLLPRGTANERWDVFSGP